MQELLKNSIQVGVRGVHSKRDLGIWARINRLWNTGEKILSSVEGGVQHRGPRKNPSSTVEKFSV